MIKKINKEKRTILLTLFRKKTVRKLITDMEEQTVTARNVSATQYVSKHVDL